MAAAGLPSLGMSFLGAAAVGALGAVFSLGMSFLRAGVEGPLVWSLSLGIAFFGEGLVGLESGSSSILGEGLAKPAVPGVLGTEGWSLGALRTFQAGLTLGAPWERDAVKLRVSSLKKISNEMFGIWIDEVPKA